MVYRKAVNTENIETEKQREAYVIISFGNLFTSVLVSGLALRHQMYLHGHRERKHRRNRKPN